MGLWQSQSFALGLPKPHPLLCSSKKWQDYTGSAKMLGNRLPKPVSQATQQDGEPVSVSVSEGLFFFLLLFPDYLKPSFWSPADPGIFILEKQVVRQETGAHLETPCGNPGG